MSLYLYCYLYSDLDTLEFQMSLQSHFCPNNISTTQKKSYKIQSCQKKQIIIYCQSLSAICDINVECYQYCHDIFKIYCCKTETS